MTYQISMQEIKGDDTTSGSNFFGIFLRTSVITGGKYQGYTFEVLNQNGGAAYNFFKYDGTQQGSPWINLWPGSGKTQKAGNEFHQGQGSKNINTIKVVANGNSFTLFVNGTQVGSVNDSSYAKGFMGMMVAQKNTEVAFSNLLVTAP
jgi:hypothetical protein